MQKISYMISLKFLINGMELYVEILKFSKTIFFKEQNIVKEHRKIF